MNKNYSDYLLAHKDQIEQSMSRFSVSKTGKPKLKSVFSNTKGEKSASWRGRPYHINNEPERRLENDIKRFRNDVWKGRSPG
jgi:hypothetical protein